MDDCLAILLVGGRGTRLQGLTKNKTKSYVSFLGKYRIIDFPLSSLSFSGITSVGIVTQYQPLKLMKYIGNGEAWDLDVIDSGITFLTPFEKETNEFNIQNGTADAVLSQIDYIKESSAKYVLILSGDQIYEIDFRKVLEEHIKNNAELTILTKDIENDDLSRFGIVEYDENHKITGFEEKPENPKTNHISLGMYLFNRDYLLEKIELAKELTDFGRDLIPYLIKENGNIYSYSFDGYFFDLGTVKSLYDTNMYFLNNVRLLKKDGNAFKLYSKPSEYPPQLFNGGKAMRSLISDGAIIEGKIKHSVISYNVKVESGSYIEDSIVLPSAIIGKNSKLKNVIIDEGIEIAPNSILKFSEPTLIDIGYLESK